MIDFLLRQDILDSTIYRGLNNLTIDQYDFNLYLQDTNQWYSDLAQEYLVPENRVKLYDPSTDIEDLRSVKCKNICVLYFMKALMFSLSVNPEDIYMAKYKEISINFNKELSAITADLIKGIKNSSSSPDSGAGIITIRTRRC